MDGGAWWAAVHGLTGSWTWLSDFTFTFPFHALEKEMATHSSVLARRIPGMGETGGLLSMGSHRVGHDWSDLAAAAAVTALVFPVVMYGCQSRTRRKAEHQRTDAFELWCWRRLLRVPWTARRSNQSILKEINPEYSLEGLMLKLKLQPFGHLIWRIDSFEKTLMLGKIEGRRRRGRQRMRWLGDIIDSMDMSLSKLQDFMIDRGNWHPALHGAAKSRIWLSYWNDDELMMAQHWWHCES